MTDALAPRPMIPTLGIRSRPLRRLRHLAVALAVAASGSACVGDEGSPPAETQEAPREATDPYNVVLVVVDTLRADHLGSYGYGKPTSPFLDRLANEGVVFESARAVSSYTRETIASLFTGRLPTCGAATGWNARPAPAQPLLAEVLSEQGYRTGLFTTTTMLRDPAFARGFDEVEHLVENWQLSGRGSELSRRALRFATASAEPFFLYLHYLDPHAPYEPPADLLRRFTATPAERPLDLYREVRPRVPQLVADGFGPGHPDFEDMVARYDAEIADSDRAAGELFRGLEEAGLTDRTLWVVTADHGEELLEHGYVDHAWTLHREVVDVPLLIWAPALLPPQRTAVPAATVDLFPTLLELLGVASPAGPIEGRALFATGAGSKRVVEADAPWLGELLIDHRNVQRAVVADGFKYVATYRWLPVPEREAAETGRRRQRGASSADPMPAPAAGPILREELFHLADDPGERRDVAARHPEELDPMRALLAAYLQRCERLGATAGDGVEVEISDDERARLRALGYH